MAFVAKIEREQAEGLLDRIFKARTSAGARLWEIVAVQSLNAASLRESMRLYGQLMFGASPLSRVEREMIAVVTSLQNECHY